MHSNRDENGSGMGSMVSILQLQLAEARKAASIATSAKEKAFAELEDERRQIDLAEATRQLQDAEARAQCISAITEVQRRAERRVKHSQEMVEAQIGAVNTHVATELAEVERKTEQKLQEMSKQLDYASNTKRAMDDVDARQQAILAVGQVQELTRERMLQIEMHADERIRRAHEAAALKVHKAILTTTAVTEQAKAQSYRVIQAEDTLEAANTAREEEVQTLQRMTHANVVDLQQQLEAMRTESAMATEASVTAAIRETEMDAERYRLQYEAQMQHEAARSIAAAQIATEAEQVRITAEAAAVAKQVKMMQDEASFSRVRHREECEAREAAELRVQREAVARAAAEKQALDATRMVRLAQTRLQAAAQGALLAREALANAQSMQDEAGIAARAASGSVTLDALQPSTNSAGNRYVGNLDAGHELLGELHPKVRTVDDAPGQHNVDDTEHRARQFIEHWAKLVSKHGPKMAALIKVKNRDSPAFAFLFGDGADATYYNKCLRDSGTNDKTSQVETPEVVQRSAPAGPSHTKEATTLLLDMSEHEDALRQMQAEILAGEMSPSHVETIEQLTQSISVLTRELEGLGISPRKSSASAKRSRVHGAIPYNHTTVVNRHSRRGSAGEPRLPRNRKHAAQPPGPKSVSSGMSAKSPPAVAPQSQAPAQLEDQVEHVLGVLDEALCSTDRMLYGYEIASVHDLFAAIDTEGSGMVERDAFQLAMRDINLGLSDMQLDELVDTFDMDDMGTIAYADLLSSGGVIAAEKPNPVMSADKVHAMLSAVERPVAEPDWASEPPARVSRSLFSRKANWRHGDALESVVSEELETSFKSPEGNIADAVRADIDEWKARNQVRSQSPRVQRVSRPRNTEGLPLDRLDRLASARVISPEGQDKKSVPKKISSRRLTAMSQLALETERRLEQKRVALIEQKTREEEEACISWTVALQAELPLRKMIAPDVLVDGDHTARSSRWTEQRDAKLQAKRPTSRKFQRTSRCRKFHLSQSSSRVHAVERICTRGTMRRCVSGSIGSKS